MVIWQMAARTIPNWFYEATATLGAWRSAARLAALTIRWRDARFDGDVKAFAALEAWRHRDKHLYEYEANLRDQLQRSRAGKYRVSAATMRQRYRTIVLEARSEDDDTLMDLRPFHESAEPEEAAKDGRSRSTSGTPACRRSGWRCGRRGR